jgi:hypothetical protein
LSSTVDRIQTFRTTQRERRLALHPLFTFIAAASVPSRPKEGSMKRVASLFSAGVVTAGFRGASLKKATPQTESNIANDQAQGTAGKRARGNV